MVLGHARCRIYGSRVRYLGLDVSQQGALDGGLAEFELGDILRPEGGEVRPKIFLRRHPFDVVAARATLFEEELPPLLNLILCRRGQAGNVLQQIGIRQSLGDVPGHAEEILIRPFVTRHLAVR